MKIPQLIDVGPNTGLEAVLVTLAPELVIVVT